MTWMSLPQVPVKINRTSHSLEKWSTTEELATFSHSTQWKSYIQSPAPVSSNLIHSQVACWLWKSFQVFETLSISVMREYLCLFQKHDYMNRSGVVSCPSQTQKIMFQIKVRSWICYLTNISSSSDESDTFEFLLPIWMSKYVNKWMKNEWI